VSYTEKARCAVFEWPSLEPRCSTPDWALAEIPRLRAHAAKNYNGRAGLICWVRRAQYERPLW